MTDITQEELIEKILWTISDDLLEGGNVLECEREPLAKEIINLCRDYYLKEAVHAIAVLEIDDNYSGNWINGFYMGTVQSLAAIKKRFTK